jgi:ketosteroid isomerase-like protein
MVEKISWLLRISTVVLLAFWSAVHIAHAQSAVTPQDEAAVRQVIEDQLQAFSTGDHERAYSHASPGIRQIFPNVDSFIDMVRNGYGAIYQSQAHAFGRNLMVGGEIHQEVIITGPDGKQWQAVYTLARQADGNWQITGVKMNPFKALST